MDQKEIEYIKAIENICQKFIKGKVSGGIPQHFNITNFIAEVRIVLNCIEWYALRPDNGWDNGN